MPFDRRKLLKSVPAGMAALMLPRSAKAESKGGEPALDGSVDVAIVGGGVAGCYVAYRLLNGELGAGSPLAALAQQNGGKLNVGLFEYSGRVGGRMLSAEIPQKLNPDLGIGEGPGNRDTGARKHAEFGGFRFQPQMHIVADLAEHLGLEHEPFPVDEPPENPIYLRGKRFLNGTLPAPADLPYNFTERENVLMAGGGNFETYVENQAFAGYLPDTDETDSNPALKPYPGPGPNGWIYLRTRYQAAFQAKEWGKVETLRTAYETAKQVARVDGRLLNDWSWWALMTRFLSSEAIAFLEDSGGYNSLWSPGNVPANVDEDFYFPTAADLYPEIYAKSSKDPKIERKIIERQIEDACTKTAWRHIASGYSDIPNRLYQGFLDKGGTGYLQHQLLSFDHDGAGGYVLRFFQRESGTLTTAEAEGRCQADPASCRTYGAKYVILTLPRRSLELLDQGNFFFTNPTVNQLLGSVLDVPAMRIFMAYERPWWTEAETSVDENGVRYPAPTCGRSTTDLRVRQFYYWHTATDGGNSFVLASYVNAEAERYWRELQEGPGPYDRYQGAVPPTGPPRFDAAQGHGPRAGSDDMGKFAHQDLVEVIGPLKDKATPPLPYYIHYQNWTKDPWGAGWHAWTAGNNEVTLIPRILQPLPDEHLYLCGETYSNVQGWVQGALNTSEVLLQTKLGLAYPKWLSKGGTWLGPGSEHIPVT